jgi:zinc protease
MAVAAEVVDTTLDNGLRVIVKPDHRAPVVTTMVWYKVGSSYEHDGITGVSHVLEHMMFKGTERYPAGRFSSIISANGGSQNAFTGRDITAYYQDIERSRLAVSFELEADRMRGLILDEAEFIKENKVVQEERRLRTDDKPQGLAAERFMASAFVSSGYHWPIIGWMSDLQQMKVGDLKDWYQRWYGPNNATVVVVGDVDPDEVIALAKTHFGALNPTEPTPVAPHRPEIKRLGERRIVVKAPAKLPYLMMGYQVPVLTDDADSWEPYALEVLNWVLDGDGSSRLSRELVRGSEIAAGVSTSYDLYSRNQTLFTFSGVPAKGTSVAQLEQALKQQVVRMQKTLVSAEELERVRNGAMAQEVFGRDSVNYQANQIGKLVTVGLDWRLADAYVDRLQAVTPAQIQAVARKYLIDDRLTVATLLPQSIEDANQAAANDRENNDAG